jgi:hypothetical protein
MQRTDYLETLLAPRRSISPEEGETATAAHLLRLEGRTPPDRIPAEIERLQKSAAKADAK